MPPPIWLETERLALRPFGPEDLRWFLDLYRDPDVARYIGGSRPAAELEDLFRTRVLDYYDAHPGLGIWMTIERATGDFVGFHLLNHLRGEPDIQVGYALLQDRWGLGYATEMAGALLRYGFRTLRLPRIVAITNIPNVASQRVLEKIGLLRGPDRTLTHPFYAAQGPMTWYERDREAWLAARADS
jgi:ribosomal-protein-alanine N-acetyltransferase